MGSHPRLMERSLAAGPALTTELSRPIGGRGSCSGLPLAILGLVLGIGAEACNTADGAKEQQSKPSPTASSSRPIDRLAPGELGSSSRMVFGFSVPQGLHVDAEFRDAVHLSGSVELEALGRYVRDRVAVSHVEVMGASWVFPNARIKGGDSKRTYRLELVRDRARTRMVIRDTTRLPAVEGLSEAERWKRAGFTPDGKPLNEETLE